MAVKTKQQLAEDIKKIQSMTDLDARDAAISQLDQDTQHLSDSVYTPQEERPLIDVPGLRDISTPSQWYGGLENIGYGPAKLASHIATPVLESVRGALRGTAQLVGRDVKYQAPEPSVFAEFTEPKTGYGFGLPSSKATTSNILTDVSNIMGIEQQPLAKVTSKDYPKAAAFAEQLTNPAVAGGAALDIALAKKIPSPERIGGNLNMSLETAADYVRSLAKNDKQLLELEKTGKIYEIANMVRKNPESYLHQFRPNKIYENIMGPIVPEQGRRLYDQGALSIAGSQQEKFINELPQQPSILRSELQKSAISELNKNTMEAGQKTQAEDIIKRNIPITQPSEEKLSKIRKIGDLATEYKDIRDNHPDEIPNPEYVEKTATGSGGMVVSNEQPKTIPNQQKITRLAELEQQMIDLGAKDPHGSSPETYIERVQSLNEEPSGYASTIRQLGNKLMEPPILGEASTDVAAKNLAGRAMEKAAREYQDIVMKNAGLDDLDVQAYYERNRDISNMMIMRDLMEGNLVGDSYAGMEYIPTGITGKSGLPSLVAKGMGRFIKPTASEVAAGVRTGGQMLQAAGPGISTLPTVEAQKIMSNQQNQGRSPQSIPTPEQAQFMGRGLVENLADYEVPRDTKAILQNKQAVLAKIAQVTNDPKLIAQLDDGLNKHPDKLEPLVQMISLQFPNLFETDVYNRINGKIFHPDPMIKQQMIQKAYKDVEQKAKNNTEKVLLQNGLNRDGSLPPSFQ
jgi:hypothetical protein